MQNTLRMIRAVAGREFQAYFTTPLALVFIVIFTALANALTFYVGNLFENGQASLERFFLYHPWLYLLLVPAIAMRLWAEELQSGTIELLVTLPLSTAQAVVGKFLAAWAFIGLALTLTFPLWLSINVLGKPDNGPVVAGYIGSFLMAGAFLAIGSCLSALTRNQVIAFVGAAAVSFLLVMSGLDIVLDGFRVWTPAIVVEAITALSFLSHFQSMIYGVLELADIIFFLTMIAFWLFTTVVVLDLRKRL
ncbi:gliding motility protein GldF [invertebrate metagenome]|uniref:Gliding motility protein GldF n=1 Tax=invertebrate metagenome TaxID=1711999 RepID=A0A484H6H8_9ZZZZ